MFTNFQQSTCRFDPSLGHRFDVDWLISGNSLHISHSYTNFVMLAKNSNPLEDFEIEKYNFVVDNKSILSLQDTEDFDGTRALLAKLCEESPVFMNMITLRYLLLVDGKFFDEMDLLHHAVENGRTRFINLYMQYLSKLDIDLAEKYCNIMPKLVDQPMFNTFIDAMQISSHQMKSKKILRLTGEQNYQISAFSSTLMMSQDIYSSQMGDCPSAHPNNRLVYKNYPVSIRALRIDWLLDSGLPFLKALSSSQNRLENRALKQMFNLIYDPLRDNVLQSEFPLYVVQIITFYLMAHLYDFLVKLREDFDEEMGDKWLDQIMNGLMMFVAAAQILQVAMQTKISGGL